MTDVSSIAREMVPAFNAYFYFKLGYRVARWLLRAFYRVRLGFAHEQALAEIPPDTAVVFFINHRSNADYLLVTYLASDTVALSYGAGEWARVWPFRSLLRLAGAYILRRDTGDPLYRKVLERYVQMATEACVPHAIFAEGKLSRDGAINPPKLGMLGYITKTFDPAGPYDIMFIPVATNFDRVAEERTLIVNRDTDFRGRGGRFLMGGTARFVIRLLWRKLQGRSAGFGVACANFGEPLSLQGLVERPRDRSVRAGQGRFLPGRPGTRHGADPAHSRCRSGSRRAAGFAGPDRSRRAARFRGDKTPRDPLAR